MRHRFISINCLVSCILFSTVASQNNGVYPFVTVPDLPVAVDNNTNKVFSTQIQVNLRNATHNPFSLSVFMTSATSYYRDRAGLGGFVSIDNVVFNFPSTTPVTLSYDVTYNYVTLRTSIGSSDATIIRTIGVVDSIKRGLEADIIFASVYNISSDSSTFQFTGDSLCEKIGCPQGTYAYCTEVRTGITTNCRSPCKERFCFSGGWCMHYDGNTAPLCSCPSTSDTWYIGTHCELYVQLWMPILFGVAIVVILALILIAACCLPVKLKKKVKFEKENLIANEQQQISKSAPPQKVPSTVVENGNQQIGEVSRPVSPQSSVQAHAPSLNPARSDTLISSSEAGYDPGYDEILTHEYAKVNKNGVSRRIVGASQPSESHVTASDGSNSITDVTDSDSFGDDVEAVRSTRAADWQMPTNQNADDRDHHPPEYTSITRGRPEPQQPIVIV